MKKKFGLILTLVLALMVAVPGGIALAWDNEDPEIHPTAIMVDGETRGYTLEDMEDNGQGNSPIYNDFGELLYVDTYSGSGDLAHVSIGFDPICWEEEGFWCEVPEVGHDECWEEEGHIESWEEEGHDECWEEEGHNQPDTLFFDNDDFQFALGFDRETGGYGYGDGWTWLPVEKHTGGMWSRPDGYDIYQDDGSGEGWLDKVSIQDGWMPSDYNSYWEDNAFYFAQEPGTYYVVDVEAGCIYMVDVEAGSTYVVDVEAGCTYVVDEAAHEVWEVTVEAGCEEVRVRVYSTDELMNNDPVGGDKESYDGQMFYFASAPRGTNDPVPYNDAYLGYVNQFLVFLCGNHQAYDFVETPGAMNGKTLAEGVELANQCGATQYVLVIPEGTEVTASGGYHASFLQVNIYNGNITFSPGYMYFSQPVTLYEVVDGELVEVLTFSQIESGKAS